MNTRFQSSPFFLSLQLPHQIPSHVSINNPSDPKRWHDPSHSRQRTYPPVSPNLREALSERHPTWSIEQIQSQQVNRCAEQLHRRGRQELRCIAPPGFRTDDP